MFKHDSDFQDFKLNRMDAKYLLAHKPAPCTNKFDDECEEEERKLFVSKDFGQNWEKILDNVYDASWDKLIHYELVPDYRIVAHHRIYYSGGDNDVKMVSYSDDLYKSKLMIADKTL
mmetsp:Transcript_113542/g.159208  ORF Transcript_113542/g.159208 Transcript_113542/m.159208 type:complete len:117 (+) Transcript_113542:492-842(+)